jgi:predicted phosphodiesterase
MKSFICVGDTHGNFEYIRKKIKEKNITDMVLLHVGDFGVGFNSERADRLNLERLNTRLKKNNCEMYVIRGNHDNPACFDGTWDWSNLHLVPDYTVVTIDGYDVLMVGGAISIDRVPRKRERQVYASQGIDKELYWYDEEFILNEDKLKDVKGVSYVVTHSAPHFVEPINYQGLPTHGYLVESFAYEDVNLKKELDKEREDLTKMYEILKENNYISKWLYGHFHRSNAMYYEDTDFILVGINEFREVYINTEMNENT